MNPNNYCTLEASQRLVAAGIELETDCVWAKVYPGREDSEWKVFTKAEFNKAYYDFDTHMPAPSMGELWRELPDAIFVNEIRYEKSLFGVSGLSQAGYIYGTKPLKFITRSNPCDALADLLIFVRKEADNGK